MVDFGPHFERYQDGFVPTGLTITHAKAHD
jgi:hypothetical protein